MLYKYEPFTAVGRLVSPSSFTCTAIHMHLNTFTEATTTQFSMLTLDENVCKSSDTANSSRMRCIARGLYDLIEI